MELFFSQPERWLRGRWPRLAARAHSLPDKRPRLPYSSRMKTSCLLGVLVLVGAGCGSLTGPNQEYLAPALTGRVLDADTSQPLAGVRVSRQAGNPPPKDPFPEKGGVLILTPSPAVTDAQGRFYLPAKKSAHLIFTPATPMMTTLVAKREDYVTLRTNLDLVVIKPVKTPHGPEINAGDLRLRRQSQ